MYFEENILAFEEYIIYMGVHGYSGILRGRIRIRRNIMDVCVGQRNAA